MATETMTPRNVAAVTGPTAASAIGVPVRKNMLAPNSLRRFSTAEGLKKEITSTRASRIAFEHLGIDRADPAGIIRNRFGHHRSYVRKRVRQITPGAVAARQKNPLPRQRRSQFTRQRQTRNSRAV